MSILKKLKKYLGFSSKDRPDSEFSEITIHRDEKEPIIFRGRLLSDQDASDDGYTLELRLYVLENNRIILETKYLDDEEGIHHALEFENPETAVKVIKDLKETIAINKKQFLALLQ